MCSHTLSLLPRRLLLHSFAIMILPLLLALPGSGQSSQALSDDVQAEVTRSAEVPRLIQYSGIVQDRSGYPITVPVDVTFTLYAQTGSEDSTGLWREAQRVSPDEKGAYTVYLGAATALPEELFRAAAAQYLGVKIEAQPEQRRVPLTSVPYALKAADAESLGGVPASNFVTRKELKARVIAAAAEALATSVSPLTTPTGLSGSGTPGYLALWKNTTGLANAAIYQVGSGGAYKIGINTTTPATVLDLNGSLTIRSTTYMTSAVATAATGGHSGLFEFSASAFNSSTSAAVPQNFGFEAIPVGNNTATPSANFAFMYGSGKPGTPSPTGLSFSPKGLITFAPGQTFPIKGSGGGSVSSVALSAPASDFTVTGSPITSSGTLGFNWKIPPSSTPTANAIAKRDASGNMYANFLGGNTLFSAGDVTASNNLTVGGLAQINGALNVVGGVDIVGAVDLERAVTMAGPVNITGNVAIGTTKTPLGSLQLNFGDLHGNDALIIGDNTHGLQLDDAGPYVSISSINTPLCVQCGTSNVTYFGGEIGVGTPTPQAQFNMNYGNHSNGDTLLLGDIQNKGLELFDTGSGVDIASIGVPLYVNYIPQVTYINPNGGPVLIGENSAYPIGDAQHPVAPPMSEVTDTPMQPGGSSHPGQPSFLPMWKLTVSCM